jgi:predicted Zn finger-like uncharacterized protein
MILACPSCATRFNLDEQRLGGRARRVRCSRCKHEWVQAPESAPAPQPTDVPPAAPPEPVVFAAAAEPAAMPPFEPERPDLREMLPPPLSADDPLMVPQDRGGGHRRSRGVAIGWIVLILIVAGVIAILYVARDRVMEIWPPSIQAYELLGLASLPSGAGLAIQDVTATTAPAAEGMPTVLAVKGRVVNISRATRRIPPLRASLRDPSGEEVRGWDFGLPRQMLAPGESADFDTRLDSPPTEALNLVVVFTPPPRR